MTSRPTRYTPITTENENAVALEVENYSDTELGKNQDGEGLLNSKEPGSLFFCRNSYLYINLPQITFIESWDQAVVFFSYIVLYLFYGAWVHVTQGVYYSPTMMVMSVLMTKLVVSIISYRIFDGSIGQLLSTILLHKRSLILYVAPAFAYATTDSLGVYCLRHLDPSTFAILYNVRIVFMLILFQHFMRIPLRKSHWVAMGLVISACIIKELPRAFFPAAVSIVSPEEDGAENATLLSSFTSSRIFTVVILLFMAQLAAFAAVYNEKLLKEQHQLSLNVQNIAMYSWAIVATSVYSILVPLFQKNGSIFRDLGDIEMWGRIWSYPIIVAVLLSATYGLVTSFFIKSLNNIIREIACAIHIVGTIPVNVFFFGYAVQATDLLAIVGVVIGISIYNRNPLKK